MKSWRPWAHAPGPWDQLRSRLYLENLPYYHLSKHMFCESHGNILAFEWFRVWASKELLSSTFKKGSSDKTKLKQSEQKHDVSLISSKRSGRHMTCIVKWGRTRGAPPTPQELVGFAIVGIRCACSGASNEWKCGLSSKFYSLYHPYR